MLRRAGDNAAVIAGGDAEIVGGRAGVSGQTPGACIDNCAVIAASAVECGTERQRFIDRHGVVAGATVKLDSLSAGVIHVKTANQHLRSCNVQLVVGCGTNHLKQVARGGIGPTAVGDAADGDRISICRIDDQRVISTHGIERVIAHRGIGNCIAGTLCHRAILEELDHAGIGRIDPDQIHIVAAATEPRAGCHGNRHRIHSGSAHAVIHGDRGRVGAGIEIGMA